MEIKSFLNKQRRNSAFLAIIYSSVAPTPRHTGLTLTVRGPKSILARRKSVIMSQDFLCAGIDSLGFDSRCRSCAGATQRSQETNAVTQQRGKESEIFKYRERVLNCNNFKKKRTRTLRLLQPVFTKHSIKRCDINK